MNTDDIRSASLAGKNKEIHALLISDFNRKIYRWVFDEREATASDVANHFDISIQHASGALNKMWKQIYLRRYERPQESGGYEWVYYP